MFTSFKRRDFVIIGSMSHTDNGQRLIAHPDSGIRTAADLPGRRIGVLWGTVAHYYLHALLADHGLKRSDITEIRIEGPQLAEALAARRVDAVKPGSITVIR